MITCKHSPGLFIKSSYMNQVNYSLTSIPHEPIVVVHQATMVAGIFRGEFVEKSADFAGFSREKSQNSWNNRPISGDFHGRKVKICRKIGSFRGILAEKSSIFEGF